MPPATRCSFAAGNVMATSFHPELTGDARVHALLRRASSTRRARARRLVPPRSAASAGRTRIGSRWLRRRSGVAGEPAARHAPLEPAERSRRRPRCASLRGEGPIEHARSAAIRSCAAAGRRDPRSQRGESASRSRATRAPTHGSSNIGERRAVFSSNRVPQNTLWPRAVRPAGGESAPGGVQRPRNPMNETTTPGVEERLERGCDQPCLCGAHLSRAGGGGCAARPRLPPRSRSTRPRRPSNGSRSRLDEARRTALSGMLADIRMSSSGNEGCEREGAAVSNVLVLNFTYEALNITSFQRAVKLIFSGKAEIVSDRERCSVRRRSRCGCPRSSGCCTTSAGRCNGSR